MIESHDTARAAQALTDGVVTIRPWQVDDAPAIFAAIQESRAALQQWLPAAAGITHLSLIHISEPTRPY